jgi:hypothetical protein
MYNRERRKKIFKMYFRDAANEIWQLILLGNKCRGELIIMTMVLSLTEKTLVPLNSNRRWPDTVPISATRKQHWRIPRWWLEGGSRSEPPIVKP